MENNGTTGTPFGVKSTDWHLHLPQEVGQVVGAILTERAQQDLKWGEQNHDPITWITILGEEYGEFCQEALTARFGNKNNREELRAELVQVAAVAFAMIQCLDRGKWNWPSETEIVYDGPVIVPDHMDSGEANSKYGERYGVDWVYEGRPVD